MPENGPPGQGKRILRLNRIPKLQMEPATLLARFEVPAFAGTMVWG